MMKGINMHNPVLSKDKTGYYFGVFGNKYRFFDQFIRVECIGYDEVSEPIDVDVFDFVFPNGFTILGHTVNSISVGIKGRIELTFEHQKTGSVKFSGVVSDKAFDTFQVQIRTEANVNHKDYTPDKTCTDGIAHATDVKTNFLLVNDHKYVEFIKSDDMDYVFGETSITISVPIGEKLPYSFDPLISSDSATTIPEISKNHAIFDINGVLYVSYLDSANHPHMAISTDGGATFPTNKEVIAVAMSYVCLAVASNTDIHYVYSTAGAIYKKVYSGGSFGGETTLIAANGYIPDCSMGPNDVLQLTYQHSISIASPVYHWDQVHGATTVAINSYGPSIHVDIYNKVYVTYRFPTTRVTLRLYEKTWAGVISDSEVWNGGADRVNTNDVYVDDSGDVWAVFDYLKNIGGSVWAVGMRRRVSSVWQTLEAVGGTTSPNNQFNPSLTMDSDGTVWVCWRGLSYGSAYPSKYTIFYRSLTSGGTWTPGLGSNPSKLNDQNWNQYPGSAVVTSPNSGVSVSGFGVLYSDLDSADVYWKDTGNIQPDPTPPTTSDGTDLIEAVLEIRQPGTDSFTDLSTRIKSVKVTRRINEASVADFTLMNSGDQTQQYFMPNTEVKIRIGQSEPSAHAQFWGFIPSKKEFASVVHIKGKDSTFTHDTLLSLYGSQEKVLGPASDDYQDSGDDKKTSSEQEDMFKAQKYVLSNSDPFYSFDSNESTVKVKAYDFISKLQKSYVYYDDISNANDREVFSAVFDIINGLPGSEIVFAGGGSDPKRFSGDTTGDWETRKKKIDGLLEKLEDDTTLPNKPDKYFYYQSNHGTPTLLIKKRPSTTTAPYVHKTISETEILRFKRGRHKTTIELIDGFWLNLGDIVFINTEEYMLKGYYFVPEIMYVFSTGKVSVQFVLDNKVDLL